MTWHRVRRALEGYAATMTRFVVETYGKQAIDEAWWEFMCWDDDEEIYDPDSPHTQLFMPWLFHGWAPDPHETAIEDQSLHDRIPTSVYLEQRGSRLDPVLRRYLEACLAAPFSFFEITACDPGHGFTARDLLTEEVSDVIEHSGSRAIHAGEIIFAQIVHVDGIAMMEASPPYGMPPQCALAILDARAQMRNGMGHVSAEVMNHYDVELREMYLALIDDLLNPPLPELRNTDGDPVMWHRMTFDIDSADQAFQALKHLALGESDDALLADAKRGREGTIQSVRFDWRKAGNRVHETWDNTVLGAVEIRAKRLTCEVNSENRAAAFREIVEKALGKAARIRPTEITPLEPQLEQMSARRRAGSQNAPSAADSEHHALMQLPEVRAQLRSMMEAHYECWLDDKLPVLGGRTPRQLSRTKAGREKVAALVRQIEKDGQRMQPPIDPAIVEMLRSRLGLE